MNYRCQSTTISQMSAPAELKLTLVVPFARLILRQGVVIVSDDTILPFASIWSTVTGLSIVLLSTRIELAPLSGVMFQVSPARVEYVSGLTPTYQKLL